MSFLLIAEMFMVTGSTFNGDAIEFTADGSLEASVVMVPVYLFDFHSGKLMSLFFVSPDAFTILMIISFVGSPMAAVAHIESFP